MRRTVLGGLAVALAVAGGVAVWWFKPHKLVVDDRVDEALPVAAGPADGPASGGATVTTASPPTVVTSGEFRGLGRYQGRGRAQLLELADGSRYVRFEDFETSNGPDLLVYLSAAPADGPGGAHDDDFVSLGGLKGNIGAQNYEVPPGVDLERYRSVVVWCRRFSVGFAVAPLG